MIRFGVALLRALVNHPLRAFLLLLLFAALTATGAEGWAWRHYREAERLMARQHFAQAYQHYAACLKVWRWSASTHLLAGRAARQAQRYPEAERHLTRCQELQGRESSKSPELALERLLLQAQTADIREVDDVLWDRVHKNPPETALILDGMARGYLHKLRLGAAMKCLRLLLEREPDNVEAMLMLGHILEFGEADEALNLFRRALELDPERDDVRLSLARHLLLENPHEARSHFEYVVARQPDSAEALLGLAKAKNALPQSDDIRPLLQAVLDKEPDNSEALTMLGTLTLNAGKVAEAAGKATEAAADTAEAETLFRRAIAAAPSNAVAQYQLYLCLTQQPGRESEAAAQAELHKRVDADQARLIQLSRKDLNLNPDNPDLHCEIGKIFLRNGKPQLGLHWLYSALHLDPSHQASHQALYEYYKQIGDEEKAEQHRARLSEPRAGSR